MKILKIAFSYLRNEAHYQFLLLVTKLFGVYPNVANIVTNLLLKSYEEESAAVKILVTDLQTTYAPQVTILSLETWVTEPSEAQVDFERLFILRNTESADRPQQRLKDVKLEVEGIYRQMIETI